MPRIIEPIFNQELGKVLSILLPQREVEAENTDVLDRQSAKRPDIMVYHSGGLPVVVETEFLPAGTVEVEACERIGAKLVRTGKKIEQAIALRIPESLREEQKNLKDAICVSKFDLCIHYDIDGQKRWPKDGWSEVGVNELALVIELASLSENRVLEGMDILMKAVNQTADNLRDACKKEPDTLKAIAEKLHQKDGIQTSRMAMAIIVNALTFHRAVARNHGIDNLEKIRSKSNDRLLSQRHICDVWRRICSEVNYIPIFRLAADLLEEINDGTGKKILEQLDNGAEKLAQLGTTSQHDLGGSMLQGLVVDRQYLATYYTMPSSARLLAELAVARLNLDWSRDEEVSGLRIADFACGTGALLNSAYGAVMSRYRRTGKDDEKLHPQMMEKSLVGTDIMPVATHLTVSVLASTHPTIPFKTTSISALPFGQPVKGGKIEIGALNLIVEEKIDDLFKVSEQRMQGSTEGSAEQMNLPHNSFDLVIMNPPFTRSSGSEEDRQTAALPAFTAFQTPKSVQEQMAQRLKEILATRKERASHGNVGLASNFIDLAHAKVKDGGVIALVLPAAFASGKAWGKARELIAKNYRDVCIVSIMATGTNARAFSADTGMGEVLVVATRGGGGQQPCNVH